MDWPDVGKPVDASLSCWQQAAVWATGKLKLVCHNQISFQKDQATVSE